MVIAQNDHGSGSMLFDLGKMFGFEIKQALVM